MLRRLPGPDESVAETSLESRGSQQELIEDGKARILGQAQGEHIEGTERCTRQSIWYSGSYDSAGAMCDCQTYGWEACGTGCGCTFHAPTLAVAPYLPDY